MNIWSKINIASATVVVASAVTLPLLSLPLSNATPEPTPSLPAFTQDDDSVTIYIDSLPPCEHEDSAGPCFWDATANGGTGHSFVSLPTTKDM